MIRFKKKEELAKLRGICASDNLSSFAINVSSLNAIAETYPVQGPHMLKLNFFSKLSDPDCLEMRGILQSRGCHYLDQ